MLFSNVLIHHCNIYRKNVYNFFFNEVMLLKTSLLPKKQNLCTIFIDIHGNYPLNGIVLGDHSFTKQYIGANKFGKTVWRSISPVSDY